MDVFLYEGEPEASDVRLRDPTVSGAGGTTYVVDVAESGAATDTQDAAASFVSSLTESGAATDSEVSTAEFLSAISESGAATDSQTAGVTFPVAITESVAASDFETSTVAFAASIAESAVGDESSTGGLLLAADITESGAASDSSDATIGLTPVPTPTPTSGQPGAGSGLMWGPVGSVGSGYDFFEGPRTKRKGSKHKRHERHGRPDEREEERKPEPVLENKQPTPADPVLEKEPEPFITAQLLESLAEVPVAKPPVLRETLLAEARAPVERFPETSTEVHAISPATQPLSRAAIARAKAEAEARRIAREAQLESEDIEAITAMLLAMDL